MKKIIITIDGHSSCGKSTMAKDLACEIGYIYIDSGAMYRAVTLLAIENLLFDGDKVEEDNLKDLMQTMTITFKLNPETNLPITYLNGKNVEERIREMEVSKHVSYIATLGFVREEMVKQQRTLGKSKGIVMDGRDIGTTVFPKAEMKVFVTATDEVRAQRRYDEYKSLKYNITFKEVLDNVIERDFIDSHRTISPLRKAEDAVVLDNSNLTKEQQKEWLLKLFKERSQA